MRHHDPQKAIRLAHMIAKHLMRGGYADGGDPPPDDDADYAAAVAAGQNADASDARPLTIYANKPDTSRATVEGADMPPQPVGGNDVVDRALKASAQSMSPAQLANLWTPPEEYGAESPDWSPLAKDVGSKFMEYTAPRREDFERGSMGPSQLVLQGIENMRSGEPWRMLAGAGQDVLGTVSQPFAPIAGAMEAAKGSAERTFGPAAGQAVDVASNFNPGFLLAALAKAARYSPKQIVQFRNPESQMSEGPASQNTNMLKNYEPEGYLAHDDPIRKQNFKNSMEGTSVPQRVYHASRHNFENFDTGMSEFGSHFGTINQANDISKSNSYKDFFDTKYSKTQIYPAYVNIKNPLRLSDYGIFDANAVARQLIDKGIMSLGHYDKIMKLPKNEASKSLQEMVKNNGYDGVVYLNRREGIKGLKSKDFDMTDKQFSKAYPDAKDSYIIFDPTQVKSAIGNRGTYNPKSPKLNEARGGAIPFGPEAAQDAVQIAKQQPGRRFKE